MAKRHPMTAVGFALGLSFLVVPTEGLTQELTVRDSLARALIEVMTPPGQMERTLDLMMQATTQGMFEELAGIGLTDEVVRQRISAEFRTFFLEDLDLESEVRRISIPLYAEYFSEEQLREILEFYQTPTGQELLARTPELAASIQTAMMARGPQIEEFVAELLFREMEAFTKGFFEGLLQMPVGDRILEIGVEASGRLSDADPESPDGSHIQVWALGLSAGQEVTVDLISPDFDAYLLVIEPGTGKGLTDDDSGGGCHARITFTAPEDGEYRPIVSTASAGETGDFVLRVGDMPPPMTPGLCDPVRDKAPLGLEERSGADARVIRAASRSTVFVQGSYGFVQPESGRPLRLVLGPGGLPIRNPAGEPAISLDGAGPPLEVFLTGTAFVVSPDGLLLTNRHVASPWGFDPAGRAMQARGFEGTMTRFVGYLPGVAEPFDLELVSASDDADLAVLCCVVSGEADYLPLAEGPPEPGEAVIVIGFPLEVRALVARTNPEFVEGLRDAGITDFWEVARQLSRAGHVTPLASRGIVGQVTTQNVVYDAETTSGGSGGPVLSLDGQVVAINVDILPEFGGVGVPAARARELLSATEVAAAPELVVPPGLEEPDRSGVPEDPEFIGHNELRVYMSVGCNHWRGSWMGQYRVFFVTKEAAEAAGYRQSPDCN